MLRDWRRDARAGLLEAYAGTVAGAPLYGPWDEARPLLELFELEKAAYELRYELDNRPAWVRIPLAGLLELTGGD
jgi:maltose alpha-D-glucosyltransferase / alpha-amylase